MVYSFSICNALASDGEYAALKKILSACDKPPVTLCVGSDLSVGDSLGPLVGTILKDSLSRHNIFVYGTLSKPITAKEVKYMNSFLAATHPDQKVIAVDAAVGLANDIGLIKISHRGLRPGSGADKKLEKVGDVSILGIVAEKSLFNYALFSSTRLNMIYRMANIIANGLIDFYIDCLSSQSMKSAN